MHERGSNFLTVIVRSVVSLMFIGKSCSMFNTKIQYNLLHVYVFQPPHLNNNLMRSLDIAELLEDIKMSICYIEKYTFSTHTTTHSHSHYVFHPFYILLL